ncbi:bile acid:sodium symporter family protein [Rhizobium binae]|uniref:bile acid:sodium symporter family protein n=1 Tax=Rhizobium binae TaxID=1138190 RepID=UPI001C83B32E|nr:bile acid:sodium symporter [Rhizobium binae]MBX4927885.1 hypothetical protein [Rhizobium binae]MBX4968357.1 hypothetical protein [Rhizobium binae]
MISEILRYTLQIALISFMLGSLVDVGLKLDVKDAWTALHDRKFVLLSILSAFVFGPLLAIVIARVFELPGGYALGLLLLGLAPCAPFLPLLADIAKGDPAYSAAFILIAALGTIIVMPIALPFVAPELHAEMVSIARPLLLLVLAPFGIGIAVRRVSTKWADRSDPVIRKLVSFNVLILLSVAFAQNWDRILDTIGTLAIAAQCIFYSGLALFSYAVSYRLPHDRRCIVTLGSCTRNVGAALAPLSAVPDADPQSTTMCILAAFITLMIGFATARILDRLRPKPGLQINAG